MGCNCTGSKTLVYVYTSPQGVTTIYTKEIEAKVAKIKNGGGSYTTRAK